MKLKMTAESKRPSNVPCSLISDEENQKIFDSLGRQCTTLATAVVQLFLTDQPYHSAWGKKYCGVICFVKDCDRRSYFIRLYDMDKSSWVWEQEMYNPFVYKASCAFFHVFEADNCMAGLNFADNVEAQDFKFAVLKKLQLRDEKKRERRRIAQQNTIQPTSIGVIPAQKVVSNALLSNGQCGRRDKKKKKKLTKSDISGPANFKHVQHVGWSPETGFDICKDETIDEQLKDFFHLAGVSDKDLNDNDTRNFIYDFIQTNGGMERAKQEPYLHVAAPPVPARDLPETPKQMRSTRSAAPPPPPPPAVPPAFHPTVMPPPFSSTPRTVNPLPPPPPPPPPSSLFTSNSASSAPPPPPPPPPPATMKPATGSSSETVRTPAPPTDNRSALLDQIRKGKELHHVEVNGNDKENASSGDDARGALLSQIRQGVMLKSWKDGATEEQLRPTAPADGLAAALARALQERNRAIHVTDESGSSSSEDDGDEWD